MAAPGLTSSRVCSWRCICQVRVEVEQVLPVKKPGQSPQSQLGCFFRPSSSASAKDGSDCPRIFAGEVGPHQKSCQSGTQPLILRNGAIAILTLLETQFIHHWGPGWIDSIKLFLDKFDLQSPQTRWFYLLHENKMGLYLYTSVIHINIHITPKW